MNEEYSAGKRQKEEDNLEERLTAYYGPALREQSLPSSSWLRLHSQLASRHTSRHRLLPKPGGYRRMYRRSVPTYIQHAFTRIVYDARQPYTPAMLRCTFKGRVRMPKVGVSLVNRHKIRLVLPSEPVHAIESSELDVLLATGLARYIYVRKPVYILIRLLLMSFVLLMGVMLCWIWLHRFPPLALPIAISIYAVLCAAVFWIIHRQRRAMAFAADDLMVRWLGRSRTCQGLHALADRSPRLYGQRWGEISLTERISRVCGTRVAIEDERLTLVR